MITAKLCRKDSFQNGGLVCEGDPIVHLNADPPAETAEAHAVHAREFLLAVDTAYRDLAASLSDSIRLGIRRDVNRTLRDNDGLSAV